MDTRDCWWERQLSLVMLGWPIARLVVDFVSYFAVPASDFVFESVELQTHQNLDWIESAEAVVAVEGYCSLIQPDLVQSLPQGCWWLVDQSSCHSLGLSCSRNLSHHLHQRACSAESCQPYEALL
jgi:hypothetical protein